MVVPKTMQKSTQSPLNVVMDIDPARLESLIALLETLKCDPGGNAVLPFAELQNVHFARLVVLPMAPRKGGGVFYPILVIATNFDGEYDTHLRDLVRIGASGLVELLSHCTGFPESPNSDQVFQYLDRHHRKPGAFYVNTLGRTLSQVQFEAGLHRALQRRLDEGDWREMSPQAVRSALIDFVTQTGDWQDALIPPPSIMRLPMGLLWAIVLVVGLLLLATAILLLPLTVLFIVVLRMHEIGNQAEHQRPSNEHIQALEADEDIGAHNHLSAVGTIQAGWFRRILLSVGLALLQLASRHVFNNGKLAEIDTIHFARWTPINRNKRLYFFSNYDGSAASYQDDFIERVAFGLNLVFSNGNGWPRTQYLVFKGASDEQSFKAYYRQHQIQTQVWYQADAYAGLTAINISDNAKIRAGLLGSMDAEQASAWLQLF